MFLQIDLYGSFGAQQHAPAQKNSVSPKTALTLLLNPRTVPKVASLYRDWRFDRWMWIVADEFEIFEFEVVDVFNGRI